MKTQCAVERTQNDVRFIVNQGGEQVIYKLSGDLAKEVGEELFKQGCNLLAARGEDAR
jgi:hypothetical protein